MVNSHTQKKQSTSYYINTYTWSQCEHQRGRETVPLFFSKFLNCFIKKHVHDEINFMIIFACETEMAVRLQDFRFKPNQNEKQESQM